MEQDFTLFSVSLFNSNGMSTAFSWQFATIFLNALQNLIFYGAVFSLRLTVFPLE
jgi:hypothetical protein